MTAFKPLLATIGFALAVATTFAEPYNTSRQYGNTPHPVRNAQPVTIDSMKLPPPLPVNALPLDLHSPENPNEKRTDSLVEKSADTIPVASTDQKMPIEGNLVDSKDQKTPVSEMIVGSTEQKIPIEGTIGSSTNIVETKWLVDPVFTDNLTRTPAFARPSTLALRRMQDFLKELGYVAIPIVL
jgi:hypothetical protein